MEYYINFLKQVQKALESNQTHTWYMHTPSYHRTLFITLQNKNTTTSPALTALDEKIEAKKAELESLIKEMDFEACISIREELKELENERVNLLAKQEEEKELNKSSFESLGDLNKALHSAVQSEDYEKAALIRDEIKKLKQNIE